MYSRVLVGLGLIATLLSITPDAARAAAAPPPPDIVLTSADAVDLHGHWSRAADVSAAGGQMLVSADEGWSSTDEPFAQPSHYVDFTFTAAANTPYRIWLRMRAPGGTKYNDSVFVQFSHAVDGKGVPLYRVGTPDALFVNLQACNGCPLEGWGWINSAYWLWQPTTLMFSTSGSQTIRVQTREDGVQLDQIVLSASTYLKDAPGPVRNATSYVAVPARVPSTPVSGTPITVPGVIPVEWFDNGGPAIAYHDATSGNSGSGRTGDVDLRSIGDGHYALTDITPGEWVKYSIDVAAAGDYTLQVRVASAGPGGVMHVNVGTENVSGPLAIPDTGGVDQWTSLTQEITLHRGAQTMTLVFDTGTPAMGSVAWVLLSPVPPPPPPPPVYSTFTVADGDDVQAAIDAASPGDVILLQPGVTYVGNFVLPVKDGAGYVTIRSAAPDSALPPQGQRIRPADAAWLPKLRSPNGAPALSTAPGAHHYRLQFLEFLANAQGAGSIIALGDGSSAQTTLDVVPHDLIVDRVYIHGDVKLGQKRGIALNSAATTIVNSHIAEIKAVGQDSQAIGGWNGPGPYLISNNYLEAAGENVMFGGADPAIPGLVPSDITFTRNYLSKPLSWRGSAWSVKNIFELKNAQRVLIEGNLFENNWAAAQAGYAILLKSVNQDGGAPWSVVQDVLFVNNTVRHVSSALNILGHDAAHPALEASRLTIRNNLFEDVSAARYGGAGRLLMINGAVDVIVDHNTVINDGSSTVYATGAPSIGFVFTNNVIRDNAYGIKGDGTAVGMGTINTYFSGATFAGNVFVTAKPWLYPAGNEFAATMDDVQFVDAANGDFRLAAGSSYRDRATDGADPGCYGSVP